jgi:hypothetical protein
LKIENTTSGFETERIIAGLLTRVEVLGKSGRLFFIYAEALANHMLGAFHINFRRSGRLYRLFFAALRKLSCLKLTSSPSGDVSIDTHSGPIEYHKLCVQWDSSGGRTAALFLSQIKLAQEDGRVSPFFLHRSLCFERFFKSSKRSWLMKCNTISNPEDTHKVKLESLDADHSTAGPSPRL